MNAVAKIGDGDKGRLASFVAPHPPIFRGLQFLTISALFLTAAIASAQCISGWTQVATSGPPAREGAFGYFDIGRDKTVIFGGAGNSGVRFNDTWEWDGCAWTQLSADRSPAPRGWGGTAYDSTHHVPVIFGGNAVNNSTNYGDTNEWHGSG